KTLYRDYDCELETSAKQVADKCSTSPTTVLPSQVKENIHRIPKSSARFRTDAMAEAVKYWWGLVRRVDGIGRKAIFRQKHESSPIRHFTLMAWATTEYIGCAVSLSCPSEWYIVCHYRNGGNIVNEHVYMPGPTCSDCPTSYHCGADKLCTKS
ncbi:SCP-like protein, partial [Ostertagia ostertagi]